jgi:hypothetical protein
MEKTTGASKLRGGILLTVVSLAIGAGGAIWGAKYFGLFDNAKPAISNAAGAVLDDTAETPAQLNLSTAIPSPPAMPLSIPNGTIVSNAAKADAILAAIAVRRALDGGNAPGNAQAQLNQIYGAIMPQQVAAVTLAAQNPVTLISLRDELTRKGESWLSDGQASPWTNFRRELNSLIVIRKNADPSMDPARQLDRARQYAEVGNIAAAVREVRGLPGNKQAASWLGRATRYVNARNALDSMEQYALSVPSAPMPVPPAAAAPPVQSQPPASPAPASPPTTSPPGTRAPEAGGSLSVQPDV